MAVPEGLIALSLEEFVSAVASPRPLPGSGSVAAALGALGAALASMASRPASGESRTVAALELQREALLGCVNADAQAYAAYLDARAGRGDPAPAIQGSIAVPRKVAEHAVRALELLERALVDVRPALCCEGQTAAQALLAAVEGATVTARANLAGLDSPEERATHAQALEDLRIRAIESAGVIRRALDPGSP